MAKKSGALKALEAGLDRAFRGTATVRTKSLSGRRGSVQVRSRVGDNLLDTACKAEIGIKRSKKNLRITSVKKGRSKLYLARSFGEL